MSDQEKEKLLQQLKDALVAIRKLKTDLRQEKLKNSEDIAVIGMAMRFPGNVNDAESYWKLLTSGTDAITDIPQDRFDAQDLYDPEPGTPGKINVRQGGFIKDVDKFDGSFFDITPVEIESTDPQQRILLELTQEALENAGQNVNELIGSNTGVYIGISSNDYTSKHFRSGDYELVGPYSYTGAAISANSGRISYMMGLQGPSITLDTACSSTIVTAHLAMKALRGRECDMALAGGANLMLEPEMTLCFSNLSALSPDSRCKTFDNSANGYVRSEGAGMMVLKRLSDAQRDGDNVLAVIKGSAINQDGRSNGFTAPNVAAQEQVIRKALADAGLSPADISYVEAHGTGTKIGDPIEVEALNKVFGKEKASEDPLIVGSVKSNFGHLESAAGMASIIKIILCLQHGQIPPSIHFDHPNELIPWKHIPIKVADHMIDLPADQPFIGTSGFGITGTNGHIVLGKAPVAEAAQETPSNPDDLFILPVTAKAPGALKDLASAYAALLKESAYETADICAFTALKRAHFDIRETFTAASREQLIEELTSFSESGQPAHRQFDSDDVIKTVFVFSGQGAQWAGMGVKLAERDDVFRQALEACNASLKKYVDWDVFEELKESEDATRLKEGDVMQPLLMAVGIATAKWWISKGVHPDLVIGHSMGEIAAAHIGGHISLDDAARIITSRSSLMEKQSGKGMMTATDLSPDEAEDRLRQFDGKLSVAVMNSPSITVIGGETQASEALMRQMDEEGRFCKKVRMTVAAHTAQMDPVLEPLKEMIGGIQPVDGSIPFYSATLAQPMKGSELIADYWVKNVRQPVRFGEAIRKIAGKDNCLFIEVGPHTVLTAAIEENVTATESSNVSYTAGSFYRNKDERLSITQNLGRLFEAGLELDWKKVYHRPASFVSLPTYPWQKEHYWFDEVPQLVQKAAGGVKTASSSIYTYQWEEVPKPSTPSIAERILVVRADGTPSDAFCGALQSAGHKVEVTTPDNVGTALAGGAVGRVVFIAPDTSDNVLEQDLEQGCLALLHVVRQIAESGKQPKLEVITYHALGEQVTALNAAGSMLWGMARTIRNEFPELSCTCIDVDNEDDSSLSALISGDLTSVKEYRIRNGAIHQPRLIEAKRDASPRTAVDDSCYLITGGTSGLGLAFGKWLADHGIGKVALVSRSGQKPGTAEVMEAMKQSGAEAKVFTADVSKPENVRQLITEVESGLGKITGVIHAAGLLDDGTLLNLSAGQFHTVASPKVAGAFNLHQALLNRDLDHFMVFSSASTILGTVGQANYNAANFYMDQLMVLRSGNGRAATSVCWGNIGGTGMAAEDARRGERLEDMGLDIIAPADLEGYFEDIFNTGLTLIAPVKIRFDEWTRTQPAFREDATFEYLLKAAPEEKTGPAVDWGPNPTAVLKKLKDLVKVQLSAITKIPAGRLKEDETFKSMGVDSMLALQLKNKIQDYTGLHLPVSSVWAHPTILKYSEFLAGRMDPGSEDGSGESRGAGALSSKQLKDLIKAGVSAITKLAPGKIRETDTFKSMGIDSMQALQIRNQIQSATGLSLAVSSIWAHPTVEKYAAFLTSELAVDTASQDAPVNVPDEKIESEVEDMSLDELMKQLDDKSKEY